VTCNVSNRGLSSRLSFAVRSLFHLPLFPLRNPSECDNLHQGWAITETKPLLNRKHSLVIIEGPLLTPFLIIGPLQSRARRVPPAVRFRSFRSTDAQKDTRAFNIGGWVKAPTRRDVPLMTPPPHPILFEIVFYQNVHKYCIIYIYTY